MSVKINGVEMLDTFFAEESTARNCLGLLERHAHEYLHSGGGPLSREFERHAMSEQEKHAVIAEYLKLRADGVPDEKIVTKTAEATGKNRDTVLRLTRPIRSMRRHKLQRGDYARINEPRRWEMAHGTARRNVNTIVARKLCYSASSVYKASRRKAA